MNDSQTIDQRSIAERMFDGFRAESDLSDRLSDTGIEFERLGHDYYDCSLEVDGVPTDQRLSEAAQKIVHAAGFCKVYVNHVDHWETHYRFNPEKDFAPSDGWRVCYPHKRGEGEKGIWVEHHVASWPQDWFDTGYVLIKEPVSG